jgi:hypothetical protein
LIVFFHLQAISNPTTGLVFLALTPGKIQRCSGYYPNWSKRSQIISVPDDGDFRCNWIRNTVPAFLGSLFSDCIISVRLSSIN